MSTKTYITAEIASMLLDALLDARRAIESMKVEAETAAVGDEQMMQEACEQISNEGLAASLAVTEAISKAASAMHGEAGRNP